MMIIMTTTRHHPLHPLQHHPSLPQWKFVSWVATTAVLFVFFTIVHNNNANYSDIRSEHSFLLVGATSSSSTIGGGGGGDSSRHRFSSRRKQLQQQQEPCSSSLLKVPFQSSWISSSAASSPSCNPPAQRRQLLLQQDQHPHDDTTTTFHARQKSARSSSLSSSSPSSLLPRPLLRLQQQPSGLVVSTTTTTTTTATATIVKMRGGGISKSSLLSRRSFWPSPNTSSSSSSSTSKKPSLLQTATLISGGGDDDKHNNNNNNNNVPQRLKFVFMDEDSPLVQILATITRGILVIGQTLLPPTVACIRGIASFYRTLSTDTIQLQIGLVYTFLGGYYPTLFSSLQAAQHAGWNTMVAAINDLTDEALKVLDEARLSSEDNEFETSSSRQSFLYHTNLVLKTIDPNKINTAAAALYTSWLGISAVLKQEYARVINLSLTLALNLERIVQLLIQPVLEIIIPSDYHQWIPFTLGWICKGIAMNIAWKTQRILTASSSAIVGGRIVARSLLRMVRTAWYKFQLGRQKKNQQEENPDDDLSSSTSTRQSRRRRRMKYNHQRTYELDYYDLEDWDVDFDDGTTTTPVIEEMITYTIGGIGFWTQMETQINNNFSFQVPFPFNLITWPFDFAETCIEWYITNNDD